ncbi:MAG: branched-chain-amino-acid transaminase [Methylacidiphilales bacterium]|nr:branched-chain-amino-acid transaminase [Candidatus Methylacidiphilales bacterium]
MKIYIDGKFYGKEDAKISVFDHGLLYGDGIFEGIRAYNGRVFMLEEHIDRLYDSAKAILLEIPISKKEMTEALLETCRQNNLKECYIRLVVTRGTGNLGLSPDRCERPTIFIIAASLELYPENFYKEGLAVVTASTQRTSPAALNPAVKSLNYLNNVMAKLEGKLAGVHEVIMLNSEGLVAECSGDNIFAIKNGRMTTPPIYMGALGGITRMALFKLAKELGVELHEVPMTRYDLFVADEIFLTGTGAEVIPVVKVDGRTIGEGSVGAWTRKFMGAYHDLTRRSGTPIFP